MEKINIYDKSKFSLIGFDMPYYFHTENFGIIEGYDNVYVYMEPADTYLHTRGITLSAATKISLMDGTFTNLIVYEKALCKLPENVQKFFIMHEVGHAMNGDLDNMSNKKANKLVIQRAFGILPRMEIKADRFAAAAVGIDVAKESLKFMIKYTNLPLSSKIELARRYFKLAK